MKKLIILILVVLAGIVLMFCSWNFAMDTLEQNSDKIQNLQEVLEESAPDVSEVTDSALAKLQDSDFTKVAEILHLDTSATLEMIKNQDFLSPIEREAKVLATNNNNKEIQALKLKYKDILTDKQLNDILNMAYLLGYVEANSDILPAAVGERVVLLYVPTLNNLLTSLSSQFSSEEAELAFSDEILNVIKSFDYSHSH